MNGNYSSTISLSGSTGKISMTGKEITLNTIANEEIKYTSNNNGIKICSGNGKYGIRIFDNANKSSLNGFYKGGINLSSNTVIQICSPSIRLYPTSDKSEEDQQISNVRGDSCSFYISSDRCDINSPKIYLGHQTGAIYTYCGTDNTSSGFIKGWTGTYGDLRFFNGICAG